MTKKYKCPYGLYDKRYKFLLCKKAKGDKVINDAVAAVEVMCYYSKWCSCVNAPINCEGAKECYEKLSRKV